MMHFMITYPFCETTQSTRVMWKALCNLKHRLLFLSSFKTTQSIGCQTFHSEFSDSSGWQSRRPDPGRLLDLGALLFVEINHSMDPKLTEWID